MNNTALNLVNVTLEYPDGDGTLKALDAVNLKLAPGEFLSLVGPSGSGKSSLLAVAATLVRPTAGLVVIDGSDAGGLSDAGRTALRRDKIGIIFQQPNLLPSLTALEQLVIGDHLRGKPARAAAGRAAALLDLVGLAPAPAKRPHQLSGGQRQRVNIARALMGDPAVLLVDEPTAALDHERSEAIVRLLRRVTDEFERGHGHGHPRHRLRPADGRRGEHARRPALRPRQAVSCGAAAEAAAGRYPRSRGAEPRDRICPSGHILRRGIPASRSRRDPGGVEEEHRYTPGSGVRQGTGLRTGRRMHPPEVHQAGAEVPADVVLVVRRQPGGRGHL